MRKYGQGWFDESRRHSLARQGIKTGRKVNYMYDLETIKQMNIEQAKKAKGKLPLIYSGNPEDLRSIPNFGDYIPKGWKLVKTHFVDSSGLGRPGESALTFNQFAQRAETGKGYAIIEEGQFQVKIGEFEKSNYAKNSKINKTFRIKYSDKAPDYVTARNKKEALLKYSEDVHKLDSRQTIKSIMKVLNEEIGYGSLKVDEVVPVKRVKKFVTYKKVK